LIFHSIIVGVYAATDAEMSVRTEDMLLSGQLPERGADGMFISRTLNKNAFIGPAILPGRRCIHILKPAVTQSPEGLALSRLLIFGLHDKIRVTRDVMGKRTDEFGHGQMVLDSISISSR
jgi:hypothetical protein